MERYMVRNPDSALTGALMQRANKTICTTLLKGLPQLRYISMTVEERSFEFWTLVEDGFNRG